MAWKVVNRGVIPGGCGGCFHKMREHYNVVTEPPNFKKVTKISKSIRKRERK